LRAGHTILIFLLLGAGAFLLLALPVQIRFLFERKGGKHSLFLRVGIFNGKIGIGTKFFTGAKQKARSGRLKVIGKLRVKSVSQPHRVARLHRLLSLREFYFYYRKMKRIRLLFQDFLRKSYCSRLHWETTVGLTDYAATGIATGMAWAWKGILLGFISRSVAISPSGMKILVSPDFGKPHFESRLDCILETRLGHIIIEFLRFFAWWRKI
jgi:hypothetical protein